MLFPQPVPASTVPSRTRRANDTTQPPHACEEDELGQKRASMSIGKRSRYRPLRGIAAVQKTHLLVVVRRRRCSRWQAIRFFDQEYDALFSPFGNLDTATDFLDQVGDIDH